jgi:hypothetical protein
MASSGLFVSQANFLAEGGGGVQVCTREFIEVIEAAGVTLTRLPFQPDNRLTTRLLRRIDSSPFVRPFEPELPRRVARLAAATPFDFVFLNQDVMASLGPSIRPVLPPACKIVVLSHGLEFTDLAHLIRVRDRLPVSSRTRPDAALMLGRIVLAQQRLRQSVDAVCAISPFDADLERWLGTRRVAWLPRIVTPKPLRWAPQPGRLGFVGTLDHAPNLEGLVDILEVMARDGASAPTVRVVGDPAIAAWLKVRYPNVDVVGRLDADGALEEEAATWLAFLHPIFCLPRGASTKLALGLSWEIPVITTAHGRRGYVWREGGPLEADDPAAFVAACRSLTMETAGRIRADVRRAVATSPTVGSVTAEMRAFLESL